jgi:mannose-6-phosphate isomerase-like protein (cupin superfamily)
MKKTVFLTGMFLMAFQIAFTQEKPDINLANLDTLKPAEDYENVYIKKMADSPNSTSFVIWIKKDVKLHKHRLHTETLYVLDGEGEMTIASEKFKIKKGDFFTVPRDTPHKVTVTSAKPLKVLSIQAPKFVGKDRIMLE